jgi:hypothetical protein
MKSKVIINAQYFENYNVGPDGFNTYGDKLPHWKPKGGHQFMIEMDSDTLFYADNIAEAFQKMLDKHESPAERFEYVDYEIQWSEPTPLGTEDEFISLMEV